MEVTNDKSVQDTSSLPHETTTVNSYYASDSEDSSSDEEVPKDPQEVLDKAGCLTQLASLKLNDDGSVPLELLQECLQCLLMKKLWAALIICKAICALDAKDELVTQLMSVIQQKLMMDSSSEEDEDGSGSESESGSVTSSSEVSSETSESSESSESGEDDTNDGDKNEQQVGHSCPACTN